MAQDKDLKLRVAGCIATQNGYAVPSSIQDHPVQITDFYIWKIVGQPGWSEAYSYAIASNVENPGGNESVITDGMILSAVQTILNIV